MNKLYTKAFVEKTGDKDGILQSAVITSEILDREGEVLKADGGVFDNFLKNPTLLWAHNVKETRPPIGRVTKIWKEGNAWKFTPEFDLKDTFAAEIYRKFKEGFLNAFSIGFLPLEQDGNTYNKWEALEFSAVPVPANAEATVQLRAKGFETAEWKDLTKKEKDTFKEDVAGAGNLAHSSGDEGYKNTYIGNEVGYSTTSGYQNTAIGANSGKSITEGFRNVFIGYLAGNATNTGDLNVFIGYGAGKVNTGGNNTVAIGSSAGMKLTTGLSNVLIGLNAGTNITGTGNNTIVGASAGSGLNSAFNTLMGNYCGASISSGAKNTAMGVDANRYSNTGSGNVALGYWAGRGPAGKYAATNNTLIGYYAGASITTGVGSDNVIIGAQAGLTVTGASNVLIGHDVASTQTAISNQLWIDNSNTTTPLIYGEFDNVLVRFAGKVAFTQIDNNEYIDSLADGYMDYGTTTAHRFNTDKLVILASGNVGIGTTSPSSKFEVNSGDIRVTGGGFIDDGTILSVPDYVFEVDYSLPTLSELRDYVGLNKHLPNMPSMEDTDGWGNLSLQARDMKFLEKIEENTLYILGLDGEIREIRDEVGELREDMGTLQRRAGIRDERITELEEAEETPEVTPEATESADVADPPEADSEAAHAPQLQDLPEADLTEYDELTIKETLTSIGKTYLADTNIAGTLTVGLISFDELENSIDSLAGPLKLQANALQKIEFEGGQIVMTTEGNLHIKEGVIYGNDKMRGAETVEHLSTSLEVARQWDVPPVAITATPGWNTTVWVTEIGEEGFTLNFGTAPTEEKKVYWQALW